MSEDRTREWLGLARAALVAEAEGIAQAADRLDGSLVDAVDLILCHPGKLVVSAVGKSGYVARKLVSTLCSTGTTAVFLHPTEAVHGDLGVYEPGDPTLLVSKSGATDELVRLVPVLRSFTSPLIGIIGAAESPLARQMDIVLDASVRSEADAHDLAPTTSTAVAMALGDALAVTLMHARDFTPQDFARFHPGGQLGRNLLLRVADVMYGAADVPHMAAEEPLREVVVAMTERPLGAACVVASDGGLAGLVTDGDLRRALRTHDDIRGLTAADVMTASPTTIAADARLGDALRLMEDRPSQISVLPVVAADGNRWVGLVRIHDIYRPHDPVGRSV